MGKHAKSNKDDKKKDEKKNEEQGFSRFLKKRAPLYLILSTVFLVLLIPELSQNDLESIITSDLSENEMKAADLVKFYNGPDEEGHRIIDALSDRIKTEYEDEKIFEHKDTKAVFDVNALNEETDDANYQVHFTFETYKENTEYIWNVNIETGKIDAGNSDAKKITDIVDYFD